MMNMGQQTMMNNPFMEMFKAMDINKMMQNWQNMIQAMDMNKMMQNWQQWQNMMQANDTNKIMQKFFPMNLCGDHANFDMGNFVQAGMKNMQSMNEVSQNMADIYQDVMKRKAEMMQAHMSEMFNLMKALSMSSSMEDGMAKQSEYVRKSFEKMMNDFNELTQMCSNNNMKNFEMMSDKLDQSMNNLQDAIKETAQKKKK